MRRALTLSELLVVLAIAGIVAALIIPAVYHFLYAPKCIKGHYEKQWMTPAPCYIKSGDIMIPIQQPPRQVDCWVCDQYEVEKPQ